MKRILIPAPVNLTIPGKEPIRYSFADFLTDNTLIDDKFGRSARMLKASIAIEARLTTLTGSLGEMLTLDDFEHALLVEVSQEPSRPYVVAAVRQLMPFLDAITSAEDC